MIMKILYHHRVASKDGQYVHIEELTNALKEQGHEIIMVCPKIAETKDFGSEGGIVPFLKKHIPQAAYELMELAYSVYAFVKLAKAVRKHKPDCLYERYNLYMVAGVWLKKVFNISMLSEVNAPLLDERSKYNGIALTGLARWSERYVWSNADYVLPVTQVLADRVAREGVDNKRIKVIPNGINLKRFGSIPDIQDAKVKLGLGDSLVLGFTGFVREWHRLDKVVELLADSSQAQRRHLLLVGDGPARSSVEQRAKELGVSGQVTITGVVGRDKVSEYVSAFDIALQPDVVPYASPLKLFEYLAMGRAIVAPDTPNIREVLEDEYNALLFDPDRFETFIELIRKMCADDSLRQRLAFNAKQTITDRRYTWENNASTVVRLFQALGVKG